MVLNRIANRALVCVLFSAACCGGGKDESHGEHSDPAADIEPGPIAEFLQSVMTNFTADRDPLIGDAMVHTSLCVCTSTRRRAT